MCIQWYRYIKTFLPALAILMAGLLNAGQLAANRTNTENDVQSISVPGQLAPRLQNLGNHKFPVTTNSARAQLFINQGLMLAYGFNHAEAQRSFREAARLDPECAMAYWGMALVLGPNINMPMPHEAEPQTKETLRVLESVMAQNLNHPRAIHLYFHLVEFARSELAEARAERLRK